MRIVESDTRYRRPNSTWISSNLCIHIELRERLRHAQLFIPGNSMRGIAFIMRCPVMPALVGNKLIVLTMQRPLDITSRISPLSQHTRPNAAAATS